MRTWPRAISNWAIQNLLWGFIQWGYSKYLGGAVIGAILARLALLDQYPRTIVALVFLVGFTVTVWGLNGLLWFAERRREQQTFVGTAAVEPNKVPQRPVATPRELQSKYLSGRSFHINDPALTGDSTPTIRERTFEDCDIDGPAIILSQGAGGFTDCEFDGPVDALFLEVPHRPMLIGVIVLIDCVFRRCHFRRIAILDTPENVERIKKLFQIRL